MDDFNLSSSDYQNLYQFSTHHLEKFWAEQAIKYITWHKQWKQVFQGDFYQPQEIQWFLGAKLNACYNCIDRHIEERGHLPAIIWEGDDPKHSFIMTYLELHTKVCQFANVLKKLGIKKGDYVCIYLPMVPEVIIATLACARIGAIHNIVFAGFSADALLTRINDSGSRIIITTDIAFRGGKIIPLKKHIDDILEKCPDIQHVVVVKKSEENINHNNHCYKDYNELMQEADTHCEIEIMDANDSLFVLYTSGSTGKPKGIIHCTGGYLVYVAATFKTVFNYQDGDIYWCTADVGWITGHSYLIYGPLLNGASIILFEGIPSYPNFSRYWEIIDKHQVNIFYTSPTALRALRKEGDEYIKKSSRKSLKLLGTVGEPTSPDVWKWFYDVIGNKRCQIVDTWWQTEAGGILIAPFYKKSNAKPGSAGKPFYGIVPEILDDKGNKSLVDELGKLVIAKPWPGLMKMIHNDPEKYLNYFMSIPGKYLSGDEAKLDQDGDFWVKGRIDDVIKVSGHRLGTEEIESALLAHDAVAEAAVVPIDDIIKGEEIYAFVVLKSGRHPSENLKIELIATVSNSIGPIAKPKIIQWAKDLPKTRSGKIVRRILKKIANREEKELGDVSTLANVEVIEELVMGR